MASATVWHDVVVLGRRAARAFRLPYVRRLRFEPIPHRPSLRLDGLCWPVKGLVMIRLQRVGRPTQPLRRSTIMATLAHELAHLREPNHDRAHGDLTRLIAAWLRLRGQPVAHRLHSGTGRSRRARGAPGFKRAWKKHRQR